MSNNPLNDLWESDRRRISQYNNKVDSERMSSITGMTDYEVQSQNLARQAQLIEEEKQIRNKNLMAAAADAQVPLKVGASLAENLTIQSQNKYKMGQQLLKTDPKAGAELIKEGLLFQQNASEQSGKVVAQKAQQMQMTNEISYTITDQSSLDSGIKELASVGVVVPDQYRTWNPETKEWFARRAQASKTYMDSVDTAYKVDTTKLNREVAESQKKERDAKIENMKAKEERAREKVSTARKSFTPSKSMDKFVKEQSNLLAELDTDADNWDSEIRKAAATDVVMLATDLKTRNPTLTEDEAYKQARSTVLGNKDASGNYRLVSDSPVGSAPPQAVAYLKSNPQFKEQFKTKYGYLPEGI